MLNPHLSARCPFFSALRMRRCAAQKLAFFGVTLGHLPPFAQQDVTRQSRERCGPHGWSFSAERFSMGLFGLAYTFNLPPKNGVFKKYPIFFEFTTSILVWPATVWLTPLLEFPCWHMEPMSNSTGGHFRQLDTQNLFTSRVPALLRNGFGRRSN